MSFWRELREEQLFFETFPPNSSFYEKKPKNEFWGHIYPPGEYLQGLLNCFPTLSCNMECYEQLSQVSDRLLRLQGWGWFCSGNAELICLLIILFPMFRIWGGSGIVAEWSVGNTKLSTFSERQAQKLPKRTDVQPQFWASCFPYAKREYSCITACENMKRH